MSAPTGTDPAARLRAFTAELAAASHKTRSSCAACGARLTAPAIELPALPLTEVLVDVKPPAPVGYFDQAFHVCSTCHHGQLGVSIDPRMLYGSSYSYQTSKSSSSVKGLDFFGNFIMRTVGTRRFANLLDIGCNDLYLLGALKQIAEHRIGVDPQLAKFDRSTLDQSIKLLPQFFEDVDLDSALAPGATLFMSSHNLEHIEEPLSLMQKLFARASTEDLLIMQFPGFESLLDGLRFDQIFHHHAHYFSLRSFETMVNRCGGELLSFEVNRPFWGSLLVAFRKASGKPQPRFAAHYHKGLDPSHVAARFQSFKHLMAVTREQLAQCAEPVWGYGTPLSLPVLAYHLDTDLSELAGILDDDPKKLGKWYLNLPGQIYSSTTPPRPWNEIAVMVTALNNTRDIVPRLIAHQVKQIIVPRMAF